MNSGVPDSPAGQHNPRTSSTASSDCAEPGAQGVLARVKKRGGPEGKLGEAELGVQTGYTKKRMRGSAERGGVQEYTKWCESVDLNSGVHDSPNISSLLPECYDTLIRLPQGLRRIFNYLAALDVDTKDNHDASCQAYREACAKYERNDHSVPATRAFNSAYGFIQNCLRIGSRKIQLATESYNLVDEYVRKIDHHLESSSKDVAAGSSTTSSLNTSVQSLSSSFTSLPTYSGSSDSNLAGACATVPVKLEPPKQSEIALVSRARRKKGKSGDPPLDTKTQSVPVKPDTYSNDVLDLSDSQKEPSKPRKGSNSEQGKPMDLSLPIDPNEPPYCVCQRPAFGEMIGCDAMDECKYEWFHLECLGLKRAPPGSWYCPDCAASRKINGKR